MQRQALVAEDETIQCGLAAPGDIFGSSGGAAFKALPPLNVAAQVNLVFCRQQWIATGSFLEAINDVQRGMFGYPHGILADRMRFVRLCFTLY
jgi:hypothetical protein